MDQNQYIMPHLGGIQIGVIAINNPACLKLGNPPQTGRRRQANAGGKVNIADPRIFLKMGQNGAVDTIHKWRLTKISLIE